MEELPYQEPEFKSAWEEWIAYRKEIKRPYKSKRSIMQQLRWFRTNRLTVEQAVFVIYECMRLTWEGIYIPKNMPNGTSRATAISNSFKATESAFANLQGRINTAMCPRD